MAEKNSNRLGALWVNEPKSDKSPVLTGEIDGQRVSVFQNKKWSKDDQSKQPKFHVLRALQKDAK